MSFYSRHASNPSGGFANNFDLEDDIKESDRFVDDASLDPAIQARQQAMQRQREIALQKAKKSVGGIETTTQRTISRAAPMSFSNGFDGLNDLAGNSFGSFGNDLSGIGGLARNNSTRSNSSTLANAIQERDRRLTSGSIDQERNAEKELASRGIAPTFDPTVERSSSKNVLPPSARSSNPPSHAAAPSGRARLASAKSDTSDSDESYENNLHFEDNSLRTGRVPSQVAQKALPPPQKFQNTVSDDGNSQSVDDSSSSVKPVHYIPPVSNLDREELTSPAPTLTPSPPPQVMDWTDLKKALTQPIPKAAGVLQCRIERSKTPLSMSYPVYSLFLDSDDRFLLAAKKRSQNKTSNYLISLDKRDLNKDSGSYIGKLRSNFVGTEFIIYDNGVSPDEYRGDTDSLRQELGVILYASNVLGSRGPRKMKVAIPRVTPEGKRVLFQPAAGEETMASQLAAGYIKDMEQLHNKKPSWNEKVGAYVLNFNGRVTQASVKNFQLVFAGEENVLLQFGRIAKDVFTMDFQHPLSPLQAFAICLSSFDSKLACE